ncbi:DDE-type integrase/transposase/recombinase, partial [Kribbella sp. CWNU-51]
MEVRFAIGALVVLDDVPRGAVSRLCREYGISRDTFYRYRAQLESEGLAGLLPKSRRPHRSPNATPPEVVQLLVAKHHELVAQGWDGGARSVRSWLRLAGIGQIPSARTVHKILAAQGCVEASAAKRPHSSYRRFEAMSPNGMWQTDATEWRLASGTKVVIVRVVDDHSRKILATLAAESEDGASVWACMKTALNRHGKPVVVLSDNGAAFSARRRWKGAYSEFEARLARIGVYHATCAPYHPQTCGKKERDWRPLKRWLQARPPATDLTELQRLLDGYDIIFNTERPHQGIADQTPDQRYFATPKATPDQPPPTRTTLSTVTACAKGRIEIGAGHRLALGREWAGARLHILRDDQHVVVFHDQELVKRHTLDPDHKDAPSGPPRTRRPTQPLPS